MRLIALSLLTITISCEAGDLPDRNLTPGVINPKVTQENIHQTICVSGWTKTVRPPASYTTKLKIKQLRADGPYHSELGASYYEEDHLISLELGGHPTDERNLFPQHWSSPNGARDKDRLENRLKRLVCVGQITLREAQNAIANDWLVAYRKYVVEKKR